VNRKRGVNRTGGKGRASKINHSQASLKIEWTVNSGGGWLLNAPRKGAHSSFKKKGVSKASWQQVGPRGRVGVMVRAGPRAKRKGEGEGEGKNNDKNEG
jgi:hypothetical protein